MRTAAAVTRRRDLSDIAYGFMASKALFAALELDLFTHLADGPRTPAELSAATGVDPNRLQTLLHALAGLGLVVADAAGVRERARLPALPRARRAGRLRRVLPAAGGAPDLPGAHAPGRRDRGHRRRRSTPSAG